MSDDLTNSQIALLCDISERDLAKASDAQKRELQHLIADGYVHPAQDRPGSYKLTAKAAKFLGERGAGLNEA